MTAAGVDVGPGESGVGRSRAVHVVLPWDIDDPAHPSGGNRYDRRVCDGLRDLGWQVREVVVPGGWPDPDAAALDRLDAHLGGVPDGEVVLVDGLIASVAPLLVSQARRLRIVVLMHLPFGDGAGLGADPREAAVLDSAAAVIATSTWTSDRLRARYPLRHDAVRVVAPGVDPVSAVPSSGAANRLLSVGVVAPHKGHDVLIDALGRLADLPWECTIVGATTQDPDFVADLHDRAATAGIADRLDWSGPLTGAELDSAYSTADLLVSATRHETYGMVLTEALARGIPVVVSDVGGVREAVGHGPHGTVPAMLVPPDNPVALADTLRSWLTEPGLRDRLRASAGYRRRALPSWQVTALRVDLVLSGVAR